MILVVKCFIKLPIIVVLINNKDKYLWRLYKMNYILSISVVIMLNTLLIIIISIIKLNFDTHIYSYPEINIQSRCDNIKHNLWADSQVGQPVANIKVIQKLTQNLKRIWSAIWLLQGGWQSQPDILCMHRSS